MAYTSKYTGEQIDALLDVVGGTEASSMEYLDVSGLDRMLAEAILVSSYLTKFTTTDGRKFIGFEYMASALVDSIDIIVAVCCDLNLKVNMNGNEMTVAEAIIQSGITQEQLDALPRITKEEFYTI